MKRAAHAVIVVAAASLFLARGPAGCDTTDSTPTGPASTPAEHAAISHSGDDGSFSAACDDNGAPVDVQPDTPAARSQAARYCAAAQHDRQILQSVAGRD
jgi:hypothetical protein